LPVIVRIPVLLYHAVHSEPPLGMEEWTVSPALFATHVDAIAASGRRSVTVSEVAQYLRGEREAGDEVVAVTFDDGYADTLDAARTLFDRGLRSTVYVTTGNIGKAGMLSPSDVATLGGIPVVEIGAHSASHRRLDELPAGVVDEEVRTSKRELERLLGRPIDSFAYPHGSYDRRTRAIVVRHGYHSAAAVKNAMSHTHDDPFAIARWTVTATTGAEQIASFLEGEGVRLAWRHERLRTRAYRYVRRARRRLRTSATR
jgi:peptidoglycan/xylan/chitin deacetylase (PgdA/CDA1 family)